MQGIGPKIKGHREKLGWSTTKLATLAGLSQSFLWRLEAGKTAGSWDTYQKIARALGTSVETLYPTSSNLQDAHIGFRRIVVIKLEDVKLDNLAIALSSSQAGMREVVLTDLEHSPETFATRITDDSMLPRFQAGDMVVIDPAVQPRPGDFVVAEQPNAGGVFRQYRILGKGEFGADVFELVPLNTFYPSARSDLGKLLIRGVMVEHRSFRRG